MGRRVEWVAPATVGMARRGQLERRLVAILRPSRAASSGAPSPGARVGYAATACVALAMLVAAAVQPVAGAGQPLPVTAPVPPVATLVVPPPAPVPPPPVFPIRARRVPPPPLPRTAPVSQQTAGGTPTVQTPPAPQPAPVEAPQDVVRGRESRTNQINEIRIEQIEEVRRVMEQAREQGRAAQVRVREQLEQAREQIEAVRADLPFNLDLDLDFDFDPDVFVQVPNIQFPDVPQGTMETRVAEAFINALRDTEPDVRQGAAQALGRYRVEAAVGPLRACPNEPRPCSSDRKRTRLP